MPSRRFLIASLLLLGALGVRLLALDIQPLWWDEGYSLFFATESPPRLLALTADDIHPPLYYLLLQGTMRLIGIGSWQARLFSVYCAILSLPLAWWIARRLLGSTTAWATLLLLAISPMAIYYAQEVRMYGLMTLLALAATTAWLRRRWTALGLLVALGCLTHYYFALIALPVALLVAREARAGRYGWRGPRRALGVALLGLLPWLLYATPRLLRYVGDKLQIEADRPLTPLEFLPRHLVAWSVGHLPASWGWVGVGALLFLALALLAVGRAWRQRRARPERYRAIGHLLLLWLLPTLAVFLVGLRAPFVDARIERQLLAVQPFFLMLVARGLIVLWRRWSLAVGPLAALLVALSLAALYPFYTVPRYPAEDYRPLLAHVAAHQAPGDGWLAIYPWQVGYLRAYLPRHHPTPIEAPLAWADDAAARTAGVDALYAAYPRLWFPAYQSKGRLYEEQATATLIAEGVPAWDGWAGNTRLFLFGRAPDQPPLQAIGRFEGLGEGRAAVGAREVASGTGIIPLFLALPSAPPDLRVSAQLVGAGSVWGEWDGASQGEETRIGLPVVAGTPPGEYSVRLTLYRAGSATPLERFVAEQRQRPEALLGTVSVTRPGDPIAPLALRAGATQWLDLPLGGGMRLLGAALPPELTFQQGERLPLTLFWQAAGPQGDLHIFVQALDEQGIPRAARELPPVGGSFPASAWQAGDLVRDPYQLPLPADMAAGEYRLVVGAYDPATGARLAAPDGRDAIPLGTLTVQERPRTMDEPMVGTPSAALTTERARLARVALPAEWGTDAPLDITLVWQATQLAPTEAAPLRSFVQLFVGDQQLAVSDHFLDPPSSAWLEGEWIVDAHTLAPPEGWPEGNYRLLVGLYDSATEARLGETVVAEWVR